MKTMVNPTPCNPPTREKKRLVQAKTAASEDRNMTSPSQSPIHYGYASASDMTWSRSEKTIARKAFDAALKRELHELMQEAREIADQIKQPSDLWDLQEYLTQRRREIDRKYNYRY